ncbi:hypothetical protein PINS_up007842 [Pythium insidiosum]|nr:hypothetical protein PINS_up007842 [Pythium insidiosum]
MDLETAADAVEQQTLPHSDVVFLNGVSSWTAGQLDGELRRGAWVPVRAPLSLAINAPRDLWRELMGQLGGEYEAFSRMPEIADDEEEEYGEEDEDEERDDGNEEEVPEPERR